MKRWSEARSGSERRALVEEALARGRTITAAAELLRMSRRHLTRYVRRVLRRDPEKSETRETTSLSETRLSRDPLTTAPDAGTVAPSRMVRITIEIPEELLHWIERLSLQWKQSGRILRTAKSAIIIQALLAYREHVELARIVVEASKAP